MLPLSSVMSGFAENRFAQRIVWDTSRHSVGHSPESGTMPIPVPFRITNSCSANITSSEPVQGCVVRRVLGRRFPSTASICFPLSKMDLCKLKVSSLGRMVVGCCAFLVRRLKTGWRLAFQDPTLEWKKKGVVHGPSGWIDLALIVSVLALALLNSL